MSNHFTGLSLGPPLGDQRLDLCDLYAFQSPADKNRTAIILNANPNADSLHPDAIYRVNIDTDGDYLTDIAFSYVFSKPQNGRQTVNVFVATGAESRSAEAVGTKIIADAEVSFDPKPEIHIWGRCSVRRDGKLLHVDRAGHPSVSSFFNTDDTKEEYNASEPVNDRKRWLDQFVHLMGHTGDYTREEAIAAIDKERTLPDVLSFDPSKPAKYPNGRLFTDDVIDYRIAFLTKNQCPPTGLEPHTDILKEFPYMGTPHSKSSGA